MARHSMNTSAAKEARRARREAKRAARSAAASGGLSFPGSSHIKPHTHGTSNEISFSVLHARNHSATAATGKKVNGVPVTPRTMAEVAAEKARDDAHAALGITSSAEEASRRTTQRFQQRHLRLAAIIGGSALAVAVLAFILVGLHLNEPRQNELTNAIDIIADADSTLFAFDEVVVEAMNSSLPEMVEENLPDRYEQAQSTLASVEQRMAQARAVIEQARPQLTAGTDKEAAERILATLDVRENLITTGEAAMDETMVVVNLYECVDEGWNGMLESDALARDAAALSAYTTRATLEAALEKTDEAIDAFATVRAQFTQARNDIVEQRAYQAVVHPAESESEPAGDPEALALLDSLDGILAHYLEYIDLRIDAQYEAKRSTQAVIDHDSVVAQEANDSYNLLDSRAVSFIRGTVEQPTEHVTKLFDLEREGFFSAYVQARLRASEYDAYLGDYLTSLGR